jgi:hypothetical protein
MSNQVFKPPVLAEPAVSVVRADYMTGHVLDEEFQFHRRGESKLPVFTVFLSSLEAEEYIQKHAVKFPEVEFWVHNSAGDVLQCFPAQKLKK